jgi:hypothetical protein
MLSDETSFDSTINDTPNMSNAHRVRKSKNMDVLYNSNHTSEEMKLVKDCTNYPA